MDQPSGTDGLQPNVDLTRRRIHRRTTALTAIVRRDRFRRTSLHYYLPKASVEHCAAGDQRHTLRFSHAYHSQTLTVY